MLLGAAGAPGAGVLGVSRGEKADGLGARGGGSLGSAALGARGADSLWSGDRYGCVGAGAGGPSIAGAGRTAFAGGEERLRSKFGTAEETLRLGRGGGPDGAGSSRRSSWRCLFSSMGTRPGPDAGAPQQLGQSPDRGSGAPHLMHLDKRASEGPHLRMTRPRDQERGWVGRRVFSRAPRRDEI